MTIKELRDCLNVGCNEIIFNYRDQQCGIDVTIENFVPTYQVWYGDIIKEYDNIDELFTDTIFDKKSLIEIWYDVDAEIV